MYPLGLMITPLPVPNGLSLPRRFWTVTMEGMARAAAAGSGAASHESGAPEASGTSKPGGSRMLSSDVHPSSADSNASPEG